MSLGEQYRDVLDCIRGGSAILCGHPELPSCLEWNLISPPVIDRLVKAGYVCKPTKYKPMILTKRGREAVLGSKSA